MPATVPCAKFKKPKGSNSKKKKGTCRNCGLPKDAHTKKTTSSHATVNSILKQYELKALKPLASDGEARQEMLTGFRTASTSSAGSQASSSTVSLTCRCSLTCIDLSAVLQSRTGGKKTGGKSKKVPKVGPPPSKLHQLRYIIVNPCGLWTSSVSLTPLHLARLSLSDLQG